MKTRNITIILIVFLFTSCVNKEQSIMLSSFNPALEQVIRESIDLFKDEVGEDKLLSIEFYYPNSHYKQRGGEMKIFISNCYASANIDAYTKIDSFTVAIYNLKDDIFELVNKNAITFFTDTIIGFRDTCVMFEPKKQFFYKITEKDSITKVSYSMEFLNVMPLRKPKCEGGITYTPPEEFWFREDSLQAEEKLKHYQKEVEYYRDKKNAPY